MPYKSQKQAGFFHTNPEKVGGKAVVEEWDKASKGKKLPKKAPKRSKGHEIMSAVAKVAQGKK